MQNSKQSFIENACVFDEKQNGSLKHRFKAGGLITTFLRKVKEWILETKPLFEIKQAVTFPNYRCDIEN